MAADRSRDGVRPWQEPAAWALIGGGVGAVVSVLFGAEAIIAVVVGLTSLAGGGLTLAVFRAGPPPPAAARPEPLAESPAPPAAPAAGPVDVDDAADVPVPGSGSVVEPVAGPVDGEDAADVPVSGVDAGTGADPGPAVAPPVEPAAGAATRPVFLRADPAPLRDLDPAALGMPPSATAQRVVGQTVPPYVRRNIDDALDRALQPDALASTGGVVVVRGAAAAGATRTLWEALGRAAGHRIVLAVPPPGPAGEQVADPLPALAAGIEDLDLAGNGPVIVWIDDAHEHLGRGLTLPVLDRLVSRLPGCIVALTVSTARLRLPDLVPEPIERWLRAASDAHELSPELTDEELGRAFARFPDQSLNPRLRWLPSWFGAADQLRDRYRDAREVDPHLAAVVTAAATWCRTGLSGPVPRQAIDALLAAGVGIPGSAAAGSSQPPSATEIDGAIARATEEVAPGRALLRSVDAPVGEAYRLATPLVDEVAMLDGAVPATAWPVVLDQVGRTDALTVGRAALAADRPEVAAQAWAQVADGAADAGAVAAGSADAGAAAGGAADDRTLGDDQADRLRAVALLGLGLLAEQRGEREAAEQAYRRGVATGHPEHAPMAAFHLGGVLEEADRIGEAEAAYHQAMDGGNTDAMPMGAFNLGWLYEQQRRTDEAIAAYERAVDSGHPEAGPMAAYNLAWLLEQQRRRKEAEGLYRRAIASGHPDIGPMAAVSLGILLERLQRGREARKLFERVATSDHEEAAAAAKRRLRGRSRR